MGLEKFVGLTEGLAAEKSPVCRQGAGVRRLQDQVVGIGEHRFFHLGRSSPQDKHDRPVFFIPVSYTHLVVNSTLQCK